MQNGIEIGEFDSLDEISKDFNVWAGVQFSLVVSRDNAENRMRHRQGVENFEQLVGRLQVPFNTSLTFCQKVGDVYICIESRKVSIFVSGDGMSSTDYAVIKGFGYTEFTDRNEPCNRSIKVEISQGGGTPLSMGCVSSCDDRLFAKTYTIDVDPATRALYKGNTDVQICKNLLPEMVLVPSGLLSEINALDLTMATEENNGDKHKSISDFVLLRKMNNARKSIYQEKISRFRRFFDQNTERQTGFANLVVLLMDYARDKQNRLFDSEYIKTKHPPPLDQSVFGWNNVASGRVDNIHLDSEAEVNRAVPWNKSKEITNLDEPCMLVIRKFHDGDEEDTFQRNIRVHGLYPKELQMLAKFADDEQLCTFESDPEPGAPEEPLDPSIEYHVQHVLDARWIRNVDDEGGDEGDEERMAFMKCALSELGDAGQDQRDEIKAEINSLFQHVAFKIKWSGHGKEKNSWTSNPAMPHITKDTNDETGSTSMFAPEEPIEKYFNSTLNMSTFQGMRFLKQWFGSEGELDTAQQVILSALRGIGEGYNPEPSIETQVGIENALYGNLNAEALHNSFEKTEYDYIELVMSGLRENNLALKQQNAGLLPERDGEMKWAKSGTLFSNLGSRAHEFLEHRATHRYLLANREETQRVNGVREMHSSRYNAALVADGNYETWPEWIPFLAKGHGMGLGPEQLCAESMEINDPLNYHMPNLVPPKRMRCTDEVETALSFCYNMETCIRALTEVPGAKFQGQKLQVIATEYKVFFPFACFKSTRKSDQSPKEETRAGAKQQRETNLGKRYNFMAATIDAVMLTNKNELIIVEYKDLIENRESRGEWLKREKGNTKVRRSVERILENKTQNQAMFGAFMFHAWTGIRPKYVMTIHATRAKPIKDTKKDALIGAIRCVEYDLAPEKYKNRASFVTNLIMSPFGRQTTMCMYMDDEYFIPSLQALIESNARMTITKADLYMCMFQLGDSSKAVDRHVYLGKWLPRLVLLKLLTDKLGVPTDDDNAICRTYNSRNSDYPPFFKLPNNASYTKVFLDETIALIQQLRKFCCSWRSHVKYNTRRLMVETLCNRIAVAADERGGPHAEFVFDDLIRNPKLQKWRYLRFVVPLINLQIIEQMSMSEPTRDRETIQELIEKYAMPKEASLGTVPRRLGGLNLPPCRPYSIKTADPLTLPHGCDEYSLYRTHAYTQDEEGRQCDKRQELNNHIQQEAGKIVTFIVEWLQTHTSTSSGANYGMHVWMSLLMFRELVELTATGHDNSGTFRPGKRPDGDTNVCDLVPRYTFSSRGGEKGMYRYAERYCEDRYSGASYGASNRERTFFQMAIRTLHRLVNYRILCAFVPTEFHVCSASVRVVTSEGAMEHQSVRGLQRAAESMRKLRVSVPPSEFSRNGWYTGSDDEEDDEDSSRAFYEDVNRKDDTVYMRYWKDRGLPFCSRIGMSLHEAAEANLSADEEARQSEQEFLHNSKRHMWSLEALALALNKRSTSDLSPIEEAKLDIIEHLTISLPEMIKCTRNNPLPSIYATKQKTGAVCARFMKSESVHMAVAHATR